MILLYGDIAFDGRVKRVADVALELGETLVLDAAAGFYDYSDPAKGLVHQRFPINERWPVARRHVAFWKHCLRAAARWRPDIVFAEDFYTTLPGWLTTRRTGAQLVYDAHELIIPDAERPMSLRGQFWYHLERFVIPHARLVIAANSERSKLMAQHYKLATEPVPFLNIPPVPHVTLADINAVQARYPALRKRDENERLLLYQGNIARIRGIERFIDSIEHLPEHVRLVLAGSGPDFHVLKNHERRRYLGHRVAWLGQVAQNDIPAIIRCADVGIVTYAFSGLNNLYCASTKLFEYAQANIGILATSQPTIKVVAETFRNITVVPPDANATHVADLALQALDTQRYHSQNHDLFLTHYQATKENSRLSDALYRLRVGRGSA